jgi:hypothetical protein
LTRSAPRKRPASSGGATRSSAGISARWGLCRAASCRSAQPGRAGGGGFLCMACRDRLVNNLSNLPALHADCNRDASPKVVRVIRKVPRESATTDPINPAAAEVRTAILTVLASWAGLVVDERRLEPPARDLPALVRFLCRHVEWLIRHPAAGDMADEIQDLTRTARNRAYPNDIRRVHIGCCPDGDCDGDLVALMRPKDDLLPSEIICTISLDHSWPITWWTKLARQIRSQGESA